MSTADTTIDNGPWAAAYADMAKSAETGVAS